VAWPLSGGALRDAGAAGAPGAALGVEAAPGGGLLFRENASCASVSSWTASPDFTALFAFVAPSGGPFTLWSAGALALYVSDAGTLTLAQGAGPPATGGARVTPGARLRVAATCSGGACFVLSSAY
jgi:hypothetical protein